MMAKEAETEESTWKKFIKMEANILAICSMDRDTEMESSTIAMEGIMMVGGNKT